MKHESCGKCTPCREGVAGFMVNLFAKIGTGQGEEKDVENLEALLPLIEGRSFCPLADAAVWPVKGSLRHFKDQYLALAREKRPVPRPSLWR